MRTIIGHKDSRGYQEPGSNTPCKPDGRRITGAALPIELYLPGAIESIRVSKKRFMAIIHMRDSCDNLVMIAVITGHDVRLRIDIVMWRPIRETDRQQPWRFRSQTKFCVEDPSVRVDSAEDGDFCPFGQAHFCLQLIHVAEFLVL